MDAKKVYCNVCNLFVNSPDQYAMHLLGKQHIRKVQAQTTLTAANTNTTSTSSVIANSDFNSMMSSNHQPSSQMPNHQPSQMSAWQPLSGTGYSNDYGQTQTITTTETTATIPVKNNVEGSHSTALNNTAAETSIPATTNQQNEKGDKSTQPKEKKHSEPRICPVCLVALTSKAQAEVHFNGLKHKKTLALKTQSQIIGVKRKREEYCDICNVPLSSSILAAAHYAGSKHDKKLKLVAKVSTVPTFSKHKEKARQLPSQRTQNQPYQAQATMMAQTSMMAPNFSQQPLQQQGYQYAGPGAYFPDLKSSFIFGETTQQNLPY